MQQTVLGGTSVAGPLSRVSAVIGALIDAMLTSRALFLLGRVLITFMFWYAALGYLLNFSGGVAEFRGLRLEPAAVIVALTILVTLAGSWLIIDGRWAWLGAGMLAVFTLATIVMVHPFWSMTGAAAHQALLESEEHLSMVGGLILVSILCYRDRRLRAAGARARG